MSVPSSTKDKSNCEQYLKIFANKFAQIVVQSRSVEKINTKGKVSNGYWFNLLIEDQPCVTTDTKTAFAKAHSELFDTTDPRRSINADILLSRLPFCIEISLKTDDGRRLVLEYWTLSIRLDYCEPQTVLHVYTRMADVLKTVFTVSRALPGYRYSRRQHPESHRILYNIFCIEPQLDNLGDSILRHNFGYIHTPIGAIEMAVAYRTKMEILPTTIRADPLCTGEGNRYLGDISPKHNRNANQASEKKKIDLTKPMRLGAFVDLSRHKPYVDEACLLSETPPFWWLLPKAKDESTDSENTLASSPGETAAAANLARTPPNNNAGNLVRSPSDKVTTAAPSTSPSKIADSISSLRESRRSSATTRSSMRSITEMKPLKPMCYPFATEKTKTTELADFYIKCCNEPRLSVVAPEQPQQQPDLHLQRLVEEEGSSSEESAASAVEDISEQLARFEESRKEFEKLTLYFKDENEEEATETDGNLNS